MKYCVTITRYGLVSVDAENNDDAMVKANAMDTDDIMWSESWAASYAEEEDT